MCRIEFVNLVVTIAGKIGCRVEINRNGLTKTDSEIKNLMLNTLKRCFRRYLTIAYPSATIIDNVAPERPRTYRLMRAIIAEIKNQEYAS